MGQRRVMSLVAVYFLATVSISLVLAKPAAAHVKWFCGPIDITRPPLPLGAVLAPFLLKTGSGFLVLLLLGVIVDGTIVRRLPKLSSPGARTLRIEQILIRIGTGLYCLCLWNKSAIAPWGSGRTILTPELFSSGALLGLCQFAIAVCVLHRRTLPAAAFGLLGLYGFGVVRYGVFHMTDYVYFLGIAVALLISTASPRWSRWLQPALCLGLSFSLMWTAIEKFLYPEWTVRVLLEHPDLTLGLPLSHVTIIAGFVEFTLSFYLLAGRGLLRVAALMLIGVFEAAIPEFGVLDAVGHIPIVAMLCVICLHGPSFWHERVQPRSYGVLENAARIGLLYLGALAVMTLLYYTLQRTTLWPPLAGTQTL